MTQNSYNTMNDGAVMHGTHCHAAAVSWPAIIAGAFIATAVSLGLMLLGSSLGLAVTSPWSHEGASAVALTAYAAIWMVIMQWASAGLGGYLTGRLRTKWVGVHTDEVHFRDTAHGLITWAVTTVITAAFLASATASVISGASAVAGTVAAGAAAGAGHEAAKNDRGQNGDRMSMDYYVDSMFRADKPAANDRDARMEAGRILMKDAVDGKYPTADRDYMARVVAARTNLNQSEATARVDNTISQIEAAKTKAKEAADKARKAAAATAIYAFLSMLVGAFIACISAALGGRHRDHLYATTNL